MTEGTSAKNSAAVNLLHAMHAHGIEYLFANPGTDFPPIIEAFAENKDSNSLPRPILVPHENAAVAMAHGYYLATGRMQAAMVHVTVGTANTINAIMDASRDAAPLLLMAGRSPITEQGSHGSRNAYIHWAQEMFDQAGMLRELVKWDYELRRADQVADVVARAVEVAQTSPRGPVYLSLPREVLAEPTPPIDTAAAIKALPRLGYPDPESVAELGRWLEKAERPVILTSALGRSGAACEALASLADKFAVPVINSSSRVVNLPDEHPMSFGEQAAPFVKDADLIIVVEADVPWIPSAVSPPAGCRVAHIGEDPTYHRYPMRSFPADLVIAASPVATLKALAEAASADQSIVSKRRSALAERRQAMLADRAKQREERAGSDVISPEYLSECIHKAVNDDTIIVNEYPLRRDHCPRQKPGTFFAVSPAGGLGWGLPAALGIKLANPDTLVVVTLGDGSYMFANPTACHWAAAAHRLPVLTIIFNNELYGAVRGATLAMYKEGAAATEKSFLADLGAGGTSYERIVEAHGGVGMRVERPEELQATLKRAVEIVQKEQRQVLLNVICRY